jgi:hypothetical protein
MEQGAIGGGAGLGAAHATILIDTSSLAQMAATARLLGQQTQAALVGIGTQAQRTETRLQHMARSTKELRTETLALTAAGAGLVGFGVKLAGNLQENQVLLKAMTGSSKAMAEQIDRARKFSVEYGIRQSEVLGIFTKLSPILKSNNADLEESVRIIARLKVLNPQEDGMFAVREFLSGDIQSLVERFNVSRSEVRETVAEYGYTLEALDKLLTKMNITDELAAEMGKTFNASARLAVDAMGQIAATGFTPLINALTPLLLQAADFLALVNATNPAVLEWGAGLLVTATGAGVLLVVLGQILETATKLKALGLFSALTKGAGVAGVAGVAGLGVGAAAVGGAIGYGAGMGAVNTFGRTTGDEYLAKFSGEQFLQGLRAWGDALKRGYVDMVTGFANMQNMVRTGMSEVVILYIQAGQAVLQATTGLLSKLPGMGWLAEGNQTPGQGLIDSIRTGTAAANANNTRAAATLSQIVIPSSQVPQADIDAFNEAAKAREQIQEEENRARTSAMVEFSRNIERIEQDAATARQDVTQQASQQRAETIAAYEKQINQEAQDFGIQRARDQARYAADVNRVLEESARQRQQMEERLADSIQRAREASADRVVDWNRDFDKRNEKARADSNEKIADLEEDYAKDREQAARDSRERIADAAGRLDALAVNKEQQRYKKEETEADLAHTEAIAKERERLKEFLEEAQAAHAERLAEEAENLAKSIRQQEEAHAKQLAEQAEADTRRLQDMADAQAEQERIEDEDRALRLARQEADHQAQLTKMAADAQDRLAEIDKEAEAQKIKANEAYADELEALDFYLDGRKKAEEAYQEEAKKAHEQWLKDMLKLYPDPTDAIVNDDPVGVDPGNPAGMQISRGGGMSQDEMSQRSLMRRADLPAAGSTTFNSRGGDRHLSLTMQPGAITVNEAARPGETGEEIEAALIRILEGVQ